MAKWIIDSDHSCAAFAIRQMMIAHVRGQFNRMKGTIEFDPAKKVTHLWKLKSTSPV
jgi:polyisoprenoid-binding protein YceI